MLLELFAYLTATYGTNFSEEVLRAGFQVLAGFPFTFFNSASKWLVSFHQLQVKC